MHPPHHLFAIPPILAVAVLTSCDDPDPVVLEPAPTTIEVIAGDGQRAVQGLPLEDSVIVRVLDQDGQTFYGAEIAFTPGAGHGQVDSASAATDAAGQAHAFWTLGSDRRRSDPVRRGGRGHRQHRGCRHWTSRRNWTWSSPPLHRPRSTRLEPTGPLATSPPPACALNSPKPLSLVGSPATLRIVSHTVTGARHYGAIVVPDGASEESLHVLAYLHGGDGGVSVADLQFVALPLGELRDSFVYVVPSFRSEPLRHGGQSWISEGTSSPWDYDVDDAIALMAVAFETTPEARPGGYSIIGGSRGAGVALLAGARDERIRRIVAFYGPTDFYDDWVREIVREAALRMPPNLPGVTHLDSTVVQPFIRGDRGPADVRLELARRSSVLFAASLPAVQLHHGTIDQVVSVSQAESMIRAMEALGRGPPDFEAYIYEGGGHDFLSLQEAIQRAVEFVSREFGG